MMQDPKFQLNETKKLFKQLRKEKESPEKCNYPARLPPCEESGDPQSPHVPVDHICSIQKCTVHQKRKQILYAATHMQPLSSYLPATPMIKT